MKKLIYLTLMIATIGFLTACSGDKVSGKDDSYDTTKKMVLDILQTEDGKKALTDIISDDKMKEQLVIESDVVKHAINETLTSDKGKKMWENLFKDPEFAKGFSKSIADDQKKLMKQLMHDPEFQKQMLALFNNPQMDTQILKVMKSQKFRSHLEKTIQETIDNPLYQAKIKDLLLKAAEKKAKEDESGKKK